MKKKLLTIFQAASAGLAGYSTAKLVSAYENSDDDLKEKAYKGVYTGTLLFVVSIIAKFITKRKEKKNG